MNTSAALLNVMAWHGWIWDSRRQRWDHACTGDTMAECSRKLSAIADIRRVKDAHTGLTTGALPSWRPRPRIATPEGT